MRLAFYCNQLSLQGTEVAVFEYAHFSEALLGYPKPLVLYPAGRPHTSPEVVRRFTNRFGPSGVVVLANGWADVDPVLEREVSPPTPPTPSPPAEKQRRSEADK